MRAARTLVGGFFTLFLISNPAESQNCSTDGSGAPPFNGVGFANVAISGNFPNFSAVTQGTSFWNNSTCGNTDGAGFDFPYFAVSSSQFSTTLSIRWQTGHAQNKLCLNNTQFCTADRIGRTITVYQFWGPNGTTPTSTDTATLSRTVSHEIGHALGLGEDQCPGGIMNSPIPSSPSITAEECQRADFGNIVPGEPSEKVKDGDCDPQDDFCNGTPIVINLTAGGYDLTGLDNGVWFDLNADGALDWVGWTAPGTAQGFLWKDRNGNSIVDDASELFGDATPLSDGEAALNGFEALRELDSNGDLVIDQSDAKWPLLRLWFDTNHDGVSSAAEIRNLGEYVCAVRLNYFDSRRIDPHGNQLRFVAGLEQRGPNGGCFTRLVYDVIFVRK